MAGYALWLCNTLATLERLMERVFAGLVWHGSSSCTATTYRRNAERGMLDGKVTGHTPSNCIEGFTASAKGES